MIKFVAMILFKQKFFQRSYVGVLHKFFLKIFCFNINFYYVLFEMYYYIMENDYPALDR